MISLSNILFMVMGFVMARPWHRHEVPPDGEIRCSVCGSPDWIGCEPGNGDGPPETAWCARHHPLLKEAA